MTSGKKRVVNRHNVLTSIKPDDESRKRVRDYHGEIASRSEIVRTNRPVCRPKNRAITLPSRPKRSGVEGPCVFRQTTLGGCGKSTVHADFGKGISGKGPTSVGPL